MTQPSDRPPPTRSAPREIVELREIKADHPELADAIDMQIELTQLQRRVQSRVPLPWIEFDVEWQKIEQRAGRPLLRFEEIPIDWTDVRLMFRQTADILHRRGTIDQADHQRLQALARDGNTLEPLVVQWYRTTGRAASAASVNATTVGTDAPIAKDSQPSPSGIFEDVIVLAMRPFLARAAEAMLPRMDVSEWQRPYCPVCGGEPELATITPAADRMLVCGRCTAQWPFHPHACPHCGNDDRARITSFASRDGKYRIYACEVCRRYLKAYDGRHAQRPVLLAVDSVATLPLDAAAQQKGYLP